MEFGGQVRAAQTLQQSKRNETYAVNQHSKHQDLEGAGAVDHEIRPQPGIQDRPRERGKDEQQ